MMYILVFTSMCFLMNAITVDAQKCYFPDGSESNYTPCRPQSSDQASACCLPIDICLDNSLCLAQTGYGALSRGSCTDATWQSDDCPRYCQDVETSQGTSIFAVQDGLHFCCADLDPSSNECSISSQGSSTPFRITAGKVIFNRTTGSTSPNRIDVITVTVSSSSIVTATPSSTATATLSSTTAPLTITTVPSEPTAYTNSPSPSEKSTKVGLGVGVPLGLAFLGTVGLLWRQRTRELGARREARSWKEKYEELEKEKRRDFTGVEGQMHELYESSRPNEIGGRHFYEMGGNMR